MKRLISLVALSSIVVCQGCNNTPSTDLPSIDKQSTPKEQPKPQDFGNFEFVIPEGWKTVPPDSTKTKAKLVQLSADGSDVIGMIMVDAGKSAVPSPQAMAESMAKSFGGSISADQFLFDGETSVNVETPSRTMEAPRFVSVLFKDGRAFMIMVAAKGETDINKPLTQIRDSWKWKASQ